MKESRKVVVYSLVAIAVFALLYGWRTYQLGKVGQEISAEGLVIIDSGLTAEEIPSIDAPKFVSVAQADEFLGDDLPGIDFEVNGAHRFYPVQILNWHQVVNDIFGVEQIAVTFDPLTYSSAVNSRVINGGITTLNASGKVIDNNSVLIDDQNGELYIQLTGQGISRTSGFPWLQELPSTFMSWGDWKEQNPNGEVLSNDTGSVFDYTRHPYGAYDTAKTIYFPLTYKTPDLSPKWIVTSVKANDQAISFTQKIMDGKGALVETLGDKRVVGFLDYELGITRVFEAQNYSFKYDFDKHQISESETDSIFSPEGLAISGSLKGTQLIQIPARVSFWFAWSSQFPETKIAGITPTEETIK